MRKTTLIAILLISTTTVQASTEEEKYQIAARCTALAITLEDKPARLAAFNALPDQARTLVIVEEILKFYSQVTESNNTDAMNILVRHGLESCQQMGIRLEMEDENS